MRKGIAVLAVVALGLLVWWLATRGEAPSPVGAHAEPVAASEATVRSSGAPSEPSARLGEPPSRQQVQQRNVMRQRIVEAMHARERAAQDDASTTGGENDEGAPKRAIPSDSEGDAPVGDITDRTGNHEYLVKVMNEDLMPLVDECFELAREENPQLSGMLMMELEIIGEEGIGGVIDTVQPSPRNEVMSPTLLECVSESILATTLPPPEQGGRDEIMLSMPLSPDDEQ